MASSQVMGSHLSKPRSSRARLSGVVTRLSLYTYSGSDRHRVQSRPWEMGCSGSPSTPTILPSLTLRYMPHPTGWSPGGDQAQVRILYVPSPQSMNCCDILSFPFLSAAMPVRVARVGAERREPRRAVCYCGFAMAGVGGAPGVAGAFGAGAAWGAGAPGAVGALGAVRAGCRGGGGPWRRGLGRGVRAQGLVAERAFARQDPLHRKHRASASAARHRVHAGIGLCWSEAHKNLLRHRRRLKGCWQEFDRFPSLDSRRGYA